MKTLTLVQGSAEWHSHRATALNASDAPAMLGISKYKSRSQLLKERATGIVQEVDDATQRRFNDGHRFEALARPLAEQIIGDTLSPVTGANGKYSASFDGITFDESVIFEHKTLNNGLRKAEFAEDGYYLPEEYRAQMEHQLYVSDAEKCLFMASMWDENGNLLEERHCWYYPDDTMRQRLIAGWEQFAKDLEAYSPVGEAEKVTGCAVMALPTLSVQIRGEVTNSNLPIFVSDADKFLAGIKTVLETDQDFADAESNVKACKDAEDGIEQTKKTITAQAQTIDEVMRTMDLYKDKLRDVRLKLEKLVKSEKESRKSAIVNKAREDFNEHFLALEEEITPIRLIAQHPDFGGAIKGLKSLASMQEKVDTALRDGKYAAEQVAKDVRAKLAWCKENAAGHSALFPDLQALMAKPMEDFTLTITSRIEKDKAEEEAKLVAVRAQAEAETRAKMEAEAKAKADAEERARVAAEVKAQIEAQAKVKAEADAIKPNTPESKAVTHDGARPAEVVRTEPAAPTNVHALKPARPSDEVFITRICADYEMTYGDACDWILEIAERMKVAA